MMPAALDRNNLDPSAGWVVMRAVDARSTMAKMAAMVMDAASTAHTIAVADYLVANVDGMDRAAQIGVIRQFMLRHFRFVADPRGVELLRPPGRQIADMMRSATAMVQGDCDEAAMIGGALCRAIGLGVRFHALAFTSPDAPFSHVYAEALSQHAWAPLDVTRTGLLVVPHVTRELLYYV